jgi:hypothetical protein
MLVGSNLSDWILRNSLRPRSVSYGKSEGDCPRERLGRNRDLLIELLDALGDVGSVTLVGSSEATAPGEITVVRML